MAKRSKKHKHTFAPLLSLLAIINIVGVGFASFLYSNDEVFVGEIGDVTVDVNNMYDMISLKTITLFSYGPDGFTKYDSNGNAIIGDCSSVGKIDIEYVVNLAKIYSLFNTNYTTISFETSMLFNYSILDHFDITGLGSVSSLTDINNQAVDSSGISVRSFVNNVNTDNNLLSSTYDMFKTTGLVSSTSGLITFKITHQFSYTGSAFETDIYDFVDEDSLSVSIKTILEEARN